MRRECGWNCGSGGTDANAEVRGGGEGGKCVGAEGKEDEEEDGIEVKLSIEEEDRREGLDEGAGDDGDIVLSGVVWGYAS